MRLTLLFILLLSAFGASPSQDAVLSSVTHQVSLSSITHHQSFSEPVDANITASFSPADCMEDDDETGNLSFRKYKTPARSGLSATELVIISSFYQYSLAPGKTVPVSSRKYILQRTLRI